MEHRETFVEKGSWNTLEFEWLKEGKKSATIHVENNFISRINGEERK